LNTRITTPIPQTAQHDKLQQLYCGEIPPLEIKQQQLERVHEYKYLGLIIDEHITYQPHFQYVMGKILKSYNYLKYLLYFNYDLSPITVMKYYKCKVRPRLDYAILYYYNKTMTTKLNKTHNDFVRLAFNRIRDIPLDFVLLL